MDEARRASLTRASSEEKEILTPAQSRRKAQNRAAQRAFRERKERHVRDLEAKLSALESSQQSLQSDNERLKLALQRVTTENEMLRGVTPSSTPSSLRLSAASRKSTGAAGISGDLATLGVGDRGELLGAGAAWDLIQSHPLVEKGLVDIADVCERLKGVVKCEGQGPVYEESLVWRAVEESNRGGGDELI
ncbi:hypothetical protein EJ05DRAFT_476624 [Pseudovirgaria hyperparasitica]|uniref:BZIP domain-containing protein n=1 Tax=Pseudovirgaria hyperparasitica TaxID=470096 RepID=A0A6A6W8E5_9PEZI|nr:uncharacterized protein EJ05DRAFT_476624 [Pseudovirgaria hyperparasitica]KAF2757351.1 hypothetical protein EJ05DRAFT_476624 [Pseudovirgaria hyperparasitica]